MATTLLTVLGFIIITAAGIGVAGRIRDKRTTKQGQATISYSEAATAPTLIQSTKSDNVSAAANVQSALDQSPPQDALLEPGSVTPEPVPQQNPTIAADWRTNPDNIIPDPWLDDSELPSAVTDSSGAVTDLPVELLSVSRSQQAGIEELINRILQLGQSGQLRQAAHLVRYANHADFTIRAATATALGKIAANRSGAEVEAIVRVLGKLSQDAKPQVRRHAVAALGNIRTASVLPWLQQATKQSDSQVRRAATVAIQRFKLGYYVKPRSPLTQPPRQPKNK